MRTTLISVLSAFALVVAGCGDDKKDDGAAKPATPAAKPKSSVVSLSGQKAQINIPTDYRPELSKSEEAKVTFAPTGCGGSSASLTVFTSKVTTTPDDIVDLIKAGKTNVDVAAPIGEPKAVLGDGGEAATLAHFRVPNYDAVTSVAVVQAEPKVYPAIVISGDAKAGCDANRLILEHEKVLEASKVPFSG